MRVLGLVELIVLSRIRSKVQLSLVEQRDRVELLSLVEIALF